MGAATSTIIVMALNSETQIPLIYCKNCHQILQRWVGTRGPGGADSLLHFFFSFNNS